MVAISTGMFNRAPSTALLFAIAVAVLACSSAAAPAATGRAEGARWSAKQAHDVVLAATWPDERIVAGASCVGLDLVRIGATDLATSFACRLEVWTRPARVPEMNWRAMADAFRRHDVNRVYALLGVPLSASTAQVDAAGRRWGLGTARPVVIGMRVVSARQWSLTASPFTAAAFASVLLARQQLLYAIPAVEVYYVDHHSYVGVTVANLQRIDANVSGLVKIVSATRSRYCVQNSSRSTTWSEQGPYGAVRLGACA